MNYNPSGHPMTALLNSYVIRWWKRYTYYALMKKNLNSLICGSYSKYNKLIVLGDDSIEGSHPHVHEWYTPEASAAICSEFGIVMTNAQKTTEWKDKWNLEECDFLRRKFDLDEDGIPLPVLDKTSIETTLFYCRGRNTVDSRQSVCDSVLMEAHYHGEEYFERVRRVFTETKKWKKLSSLEIKTFRWFQIQRYEMFHGKGVNIPDICGSIE
jgi:hypothetical protein